MIGLHAVIIICFTGRRSRPSHYILMLHLQIGAFFFYSLSHSSWTVTAAIGLSFTAVLNTNVKGSLCIDVLARAGGKGFPLHPRRDHAEGFPRAKNNHDTGEEEFSGPSVS